MKESMRNVFMCAMAISVFCVSYSGASTSEPKDFIPLAADGSIDPAYPAVLAATITTVEKVFAQNPAFEKKIMEALEKADIEGEVNTHLALLENDSSLKDWAVVKRPSRTHRFAKRAKAMKRRRLVEMRTTKRLKSGLSELLDDMNASKVSRRACNSWKKKIEGLLSA